MDVYSFPPSKVKACVETCMQARLVPFIQGSPGVGKSAIVKEIANEYGLKLIDCRLSSMEPTDLQGLPWIQDGKARFNPYDFFPIEGTPIPEGYSGWLLFLDEMNSASRQTQAAAYRVVLDREIGQHKLHSHCFVVAAGNRLDDNAIVNPLSTAMISRVIHFSMEVDFEDWRDHYALKHGVDERVIAYLSMYPEKLMEFDPERDDQTFPSPRTWDFVSRLIKASGRAPDEDMIPLLAGAVTFEQASAFVQFCKVSKNLVTIEALKKNPDLAVPKQQAAIWATVIHLINRTTKDNFSMLSKFINKLPTTFKIVYFRSLKEVKMELLQNPDFMKSVASLGDYCFGD
jgi:MoxR-like ATPase